MKILGITTGHDASYCVLENGKPIVHEEYERFSRIKEGDTNIFDFVADRVVDYEEIKYVAHWPCNNLGWNKTFKGDKLTSYQEMKDRVGNLGGDYIQVGHHQSHAANAFFSSNLEDSLILTFDAGGWDYSVYDKNFVGVDGLMPTSFTVWRGNDNKIIPVEITHIENFSIGLVWHDMLKPVFGLSSGSPIGNQAGTVMAMAAIGKTDKYYKLIDFGDEFRGYSRHLESLTNEQDLFDVARALQTKTENTIRGIIEKHKTDTDKNLCIAGGVALNCVTMGKILDWFPEFENVYVPPVPYDSGLAIGAAQFMYHQVFNKPRVKWKDNFTPYLGVTYSKKDVQKSLDEFSKKINWVSCDDAGVLELLDKQNIVSVFGGGSESGRRALGNRSILADPRSADMKEIINNKVKHRQWYRPFAPSILREEVKNWFVHNIDSPYMNFVLEFKEEVVDKVPAVVHLDKTGRLQTVTEQDNKWFYNFIKQWYNISGVPILLNTSFNDREPIVETPSHAIDCFLRTNIDYLYFFDYGILVGKNE